MAYDEEQKDVIFARTDGQCHICRKKLARKNYAQFGARGAWEVEHSNAKANGGTDRLNNLYPACISCNRSKGKMSTRSARQRHGNKAAPYSAARKKQNALWWGAGGALAGRVLLAPLGPLGIVAGGLLGAIVGEAIEPD